MQLEIYLYIGHISQARSQGKRIGPRLSVRDSQGKLRGHLRPKLSTDWVPK